MSFRAPWTSPSGGFSWTTLWLNVAIGITLFRYLLGDSSVMDYQPGELDAGLPAAILAAVGGLYYGRRGQDIVHQGKKQSMESIEAAR